MSQYPLCTTASALQVRFYSDEAALTFVRREFPEYFEAYLNLPKDVERADFFRSAVKAAEGVCAGPKL